MYFANIDYDGYCIGISSYTGTDFKNNKYCVQIDYYDMSFIGRKYDFEENVWKDEWREKITLENIPTQLDIIEEAVLKSNEELRQEGYDNCVLDLMNKNLI